MIHPIEATTTILGGALSAGHMPTALRALALCVGAPPFAGLSMGAARRLSFACNGFAELLLAAEDTPDAGMNLRPRACFLLSALFALRVNEGALSLSEQEEAWMVAEVEADYGEAVALVETRTGRPHSPVPPRPLLPRLGVVDA